MATSSPPLSFLGRLAFSALLAAPLVAASTAEPLPSQTAPKQPSAGPVATAETAAPAETAKTDSGNGSGERFSRLRGLFDIDLPKTVGKYRLKYSLHPHFGDLLRHDYIRVPVGMRLGINDHTEVNTELESYLTHGLKEYGGNGLYAFHVGAKYEWLKWLKPTVDTSTGFNTTFPLSRPPVELTDGHNHFAPYVVFSKPWPGKPKLTPFVSVGMDFPWRSSVPGTVGKDQTMSNTMSLAPGFLYDLHTLKYTLTTTYTTTALVGHRPVHFLTINPSVLWELPPALTFHSRGHWIVGFGFKAAFGPDGTDFSTSSRVRGEFNFTRMLGQAWRLLPGGGGKSQANPASHD